MVNGAPLLGIHDMVNQRTAETVVPEEAISASRSLRTPEVGVYAVFEEGESTISPGKLADFVVLGEDPLTIDKDGIGQISIDATIVSGNVAHDLLGIAIRRTDEL